MEDRLERRGGLKELTVQEGLQSQFGSRIGIFSQHLALLHQGRDINKISKEVTDGDATENRPISSYFTRWLKTVGLRNKSQCHVFSVESPLLCPQNQHLPGEKLDFFERITHHKQE